MVFKLLFQWLDISENLSYIGGLSLNSYDLVEHHYEVYMVWYSLHKKSR